MIVKGKIDNNVYTKLINYVFSKCNIISLTKYYNQNNHKLCIFKMQYYFIN